MKKILALILAALLIFCMVACADSDKTEIDDNDEVENNENAITVKSGKFVYETNSDGDYEIVEYIPSSVKVIDLLELPKTTEDGREITGIADEAFKADLTLKAVKIPETYVNIGSYAFYGCENLVSVTMTDSVKTIGAYSFAECGKLSKFTLSKSVTKINEGTFKNCASLATLELSEKVEEICDGAFFGCKTLKALELTESIKKITKNAFYGCDALTYTVDGNAKYLGNAENPYLVLVSALDLNIEECTVNEATVIVADNAFANCIYLESLTLSAKVKNITNAAISNCEALELSEYENALYLGNAENPYMVLVSVVNISHENLKVHADTAIITAEAFAHCLKLKAISYEKSSEDWDGIIKAENWAHKLNITVICHGDDAE